MPRMAKPLTAAKVRTAGPGRHADGLAPGLYLTVRNGKRSWIYRFTSPTQKKPGSNSGRLRDMAVGPVALETDQPGLTLAKARERAADLRKLILGGVDPLDHEAEAAAAQAAEAEASRAAGTTFAEAAQRMLKAREGTWKNAKHAAQWRSTLEGLPAALRQSPVNAITKRDIADALAAPWREIPETARRLLGRIMETMAFAKAEDVLPEQFSVAALREGVVTILGDQKEHRRAAGYGHHPALPWRHLPAFWAALASHRGHSADALRLLILTALRTAPVRAARREHFDLERALWTIPAAAMKMGRAHRVPLPDEAVALLRGMEPKRTGYLFPGQRRTGRAPADKPISDMALLTLMRKMKGPHGRGWRDDEGQLATPHGFRSSFRDWVADTGGPADAADAALAHAVKGKTKAAYHRSDLFDLRRPLMAEWASFVTGAGTTGAGAAAGAEG